jgi:transporter family protein
MLESPTYGFTVAKPPRIAYRQGSGASIHPVDMAARNLMPAWLAWTLLTVATWGVWSFLNTLLADAITSPALGQAVTTIGILPVLLLLNAMKDSPVSGNRRLGIWLALGSGIVSCLGNIANFDVLSRGAQAAAVIPVTALYPVVTVLLAVPVLKERVSLLQWLGIAASIVSIYFFNVPEDEALVSSWLVFAVGPIVLWGVCGVMQKMATNHVSARLSAIWFLLSFLPVAVAILAYDPLPSGISVKTWVIATAIGFTLALGNFTILLAFESGGKASIIAPLCGLYPLVGIPIAILVRGDEVNGRHWFAILCALAAIVLLSYPSQPKAAVADSGMEAA